MTDRDELEAWHAEARQVLIDMNVARFMVMCDEAGGRPLSSRYVARVAMHKARSRWGDDMPAELQHKSKVWLIKRGYGV